MVAAPPLVAEPGRCDATDAWDAVQGDLQPGRACGTMVAATNGASIAYSFGQLTWKRPVTVPYRVTVTWRRLGTDTRTLEVQLIGAVVLFGNDEVALWIDDPTFEADGWHPVARYRPRDLHTIEVVQRSSEVTVAIDGRVVRRWPVRAERRQGKVGLAFKGQRGAREKVWLGAATVAALDGGGVGQTSATSAARSK